MATYGDDTQKSVWNFDGAELFLVFSIKQKIVEAFEEWDLETAYWKLRLLRGELDAKLKRGVNKIVSEFEKRVKKKPSKIEKNVCDAKMQALDLKYSAWKKLPNPNDEEKSEFYLALEEFYLYLSHLMKKHGLYFREGEDMTLAVLRR